MKKYKEKYKTGMIFRSKKYPWTDFVIDFVSYIRGSETAYTFNMNSIIDWVRINEEASRIRLQPRLAPSILTKTRHTIVSMPRFSINVFTL